MRAVVHPGSTPIDPALADETTDALLAKIAQMPSYLGAPMVALTVFFDASGVAFAGKPWRAQSPEQQRRQLALWRTGPIAPFRDFVAFYEKMGNFIYFSLVEEQG